MMPIKMDSPEKLSTQVTQDEEKQKYNTICVGTPISKQAQIASI
jgi:hypothetical protein